MGHFPESKDSNDVQASICHKGEIDPTQAHAWLTSPAIIRSLNKVKAQIIKGASDQTAKGQPHTDGGKEDDPEPEGEGRLIVAPKTLQT